MLVVDSNGDPIVDGDGVPTGETTPDVSDASACTTRSVNAAWYSNTDALGSGDLSMKIELRRGGAGVLNVYYKNLAGGTLGYAYYPSNYRFSKYSDGVLVDDAAIVGGSLEAYNEGVSRFRMKETELKYCQQSQLTHTEPLFPCLPPTCIYVHFRILCTMKLVTGWALLTPLREALIFMGTLWLTMAAMRVMGLQTLRRKNHQASAVISAEIHAQTQIRTSSWIPSIT
jgi:hypothetical protein